MIPTISLPLSFLSRPVDRRFVRLLDSAVPDRPDFARLSLFLLWQDFACHGCGDRLVPLDPLAMSRSLVVSDLEEVVGWAGESPDLGGYVRMALESGFLKLVPVSETEGNLIPADFKACATGSASGVAPHVKGGRVLSRRKADGHALKGASETADLFEKTRPDILDGVGKEKAREAMRLILSVCRILNWHPPVERAWTSELIEKAAEILDTESREKIDEKLEWLVGQKGKDELPGRIDLLLNRWALLVPEE